MRLRRFEEHYTKGKPMNLGADHPAVAEGRTLFPSRVSDPNERLLKSGMNSRKIGKAVVKGKWDGMPIYTLTLEERKTCPQSCAHWRDCYGNHMQWPKRYKHGPELEERLAKELSQLAGDHPDGFVVRLHVLGDFYSVGYVMQWADWLHRFPQIHVFGYSARHPNADPIGVMLDIVNKKFPDRWWVRYSQYDENTWLSTGESGIICPVQTNQTDCCGTCGLCWTAKKPIRFLVH